MQSFNARTYRCTDCGALVIGDAPATCQSRPPDGKLCGGWSFMLVDDPSEMGVVSVLESSDVVRIRKSLNAGEPERIRVGETEIPETDEEKAARVDALVAAEYGHLTKRTQAQIRKDLMALPNLVVRKEVTRLETDEEKDLRVAAELDKMTPASAKEVRVIRDAVGFNG